MASRRPPVRPNTSRPAPVAPARKVDDEVTTPTPPTQPEVPAAEDTPPTPQDGAGAPPSPDPVDTAGDAGSNAPEAQPGPHTTHAQAEPDGIILEPGEDFVFEGEPDVNGNIIVTKPVYRRVLIPRSSRCTFIQLAVAGSKVSVKRTQRVHTLGEL